MGGMVQFPKMGQLVGGWPAQSRLFIVAFAALALQACGSNEQTGSKTDGSLQSTVACRPSDSSLARGEGAEVDRARKLDLYIDRSQSMSGFNRGATGNLRAMGDLLALVGSRANDYEEASFHVFGKEIRKISAAELSRYGGTEPFNCRGCDNQESRLDSVLNAAVAEGDRTLSLIITDLWLDNGSLTSSPQVALGQPLRKALQAGMSIGVIGIMAPFDGAVYDVPGVGTYRGAKQLPLYVLAIGPEEDIASFQITLKQSGGPAFADERMNYSLFSKEPNNPVVSAQLRSVGAGANATTVVDHPSLRSIDQYLIDLDVAEAQDGLLGKTIVLNRNLREGLVWRGDLAEYTNVWRLNPSADLDSCSDEAWTALDGISGLWELRPDGESATFSFGGEIRRSLPPGNTYYLETSVGSSELSVPNEANEWMRAWSLDYDNAHQLVDGGASEFKTLNLGELTTILEDELSRAAEPSRKAASFGFILKVER